MMIGRKIEKLLKNIGNKDEGRKINDMIYDKSDGLFKKYFKNQ